MRRPGARRAVRRWVGAGVAVDVFVGVAQGGQSPQHARAVGAHSGALGDRVARELNEFAGAGAVVDPESDQAQPVWSDSFHGDHDRDLVAGRPEFAAAASADECLVEFDDAVQLVSVGAHHGSP